MWTRCLLSYDPSVWKHLNTVKETNTFICLVLGSIVHLVVANRAVVQNKFYPNLLDWKKEEKALQMRSVLTDGGCGVAAACKRFLSDVHWCFWKGGKCSPDISSILVWSHQCSWALLLVPHAPHYYWTTLNWIVNSDIPSFISWDP